MPTEPISFESLMAKTYQVNTYHCAHFVADVGRLWYGDCFAQALACFLLPPHQRFASLGVRHHFRRLRGAEWIQKGDLLVLHRNTGQTHVVIACDGGFLGLNQLGVTLMSWDRVHLGFQRSAVYRHGVPVNGAS